jgi:hypothetical protein
MIAKSEKTITKLNNNAGSMAADTTIESTTLSILCYITSSDKNGMKITEIELRLQTRNKIR